MEIISDVESIHSRFSEQHELNVLIVDANNTPGEDFLAQAKKELAFPTIDVITRPQNEAVYHGRVDHLYLTQNSDEPFRDLFNTPLIRSMESSGIDAVFILAHGCDRELYKRLLVLTSSLTDRHFKILPNGRIKEVLGLRRLRSLPVNNTFAGSGRCDLACLMCASGDRRQAFGSDLPYALFSRTLPMIQRGHVAFVLNGEPFVNPDTPRMLGEVKKRGIFASATTAANNFDRSLVKYLVQIGLDELRISINGDHKAGYEKIMRNAKWEKLIATLTSLQEEKRLSGSSKPQLCFIMVGMKMTIDALPGITRLAAKYGVSKVIINPFMPNPRVHGQSLLDDIDRLRRNYEAALEIGKAHGVHISLDEADHYKKALFGDGLSGVSDHGDDHATFFGRPWTRICPDPWLSYHVMESGIIFPCCGGIETAFGDLNNEDLSSIWNGDAYMKLRDEMLTGNLRQECLVCEMRSKATIPELLRYLVYQLEVRSTVE